MNKDDPVGGLEPRPVVVHHSNPDGLLGRLATEVDQKGRNDVLKKKFQKEFKLGTETKILKRVPARRDDSAGKG